MERLRISDARNQSYIDGMVICSVSGATNGTAIAFHRDVYDMQASCAHDDVIKWKHFPRYWPFVRGIRRWPVNYPHKGQWRGALMFFFDLRLNKRLSKQSWGWWFETPTRSLWRHCNGLNQMIHIQAELFKYITALRSKQKGWHLECKIFKCEYSWKKMWVFCVFFLLKFPGFVFVSKGPIDNKLTLVPIMAWCQPATSLYLNQWWHSTHDTIYGVCRVARNVKITFERGRVGNPVFLCYLWVRFPCVVWERIYLFFIDKISWYTYNHDHFRSH